jgi:predicted RNase H-like nuclease (RuvC/YqgF family)
VAARPREERGGRPATREDRRLEARVRDLERQVTEAEAEVARLHDELEAASAAHDAARAGSWAPATLRRRRTPQLLEEWETAAQSVAG